MPCVSEWRRPYTVNWFGQLWLWSGLLFFVGLYFCSGGAPFVFFLRPGLLLNWGAVLLLLFVLWACLVLWAAAKEGVYVGDAGVMVRVGFRRMVVPWQEIAYSEVAEVPKYPVIWQRGPSLGLVLVAPSGQRRAVPARSAVANFRWGSPSYVRLTRKRMSQVVNGINELAAVQRPQTSPPPSRWLFPPPVGQLPQPVAPEIQPRGKTTMSPRARNLLIIFGLLILVMTGNSVWNSWRERDRTLQIGPPTPKPAANFVPLRPVGDVAMPLRATSAFGSAFTSSTIVTSTAHPSGVAYLAGWAQGTSLRIGSLDLASGQPLFPVVDLGGWKDVFQFAARPEGILVAGWQPPLSPHPALPGAPAQLEVSFVALDPSTGQVRWEHRVRQTGQFTARLYQNGVLAATETGQPALLDWTTGTARWTISDNSSDPGSLSAGLPAGTWAEPQLTAPLATAADPDTSTPDDPRLALHSGGAFGSASILDTRTGDRTAVTTMSAPPTGYQTSVLVIGQSVYVSATYGRSGDAVYRFPANSRQPVAHGDSLWSDNGRLLATTPCGSDRLCLTEDRTSNQTGQGMILVDTSSDRMRALPDSVPTGGYAIGDRYADPAGRVYDLTGALQGEGSPLAQAWWLTPGSLVGIDRENTAGTAGATQPAALVAVSTVDGSRTVLAKLPGVPFQATTGNGYLVYADDDGFHAWQYAEP
jgi:hypothetical protein